MNAIEIRVGSQLWLEGQLWEVQDLTGREATLRAGAAFRSVSVPILVAHARVLGSPELAGSVDEPSNVLLASLTGSQRRKLQDRVRIVQDLLAADDRQLQERTAEMAQAEGMSVRTLERWLKSYREAGPAGLVDARLLRDRPGTVDPRWDVACLAVLREFVSSSTPTMNVVIDRVRERVDEEHGLGVVPMPSRATAYRRLGELSKGRHAFGSGKAGA